MALLPNRAYPQPTASHPVRPAIIGYYCVYCQHQSRNPSRLFTVKDIAASGAASQLTAIYYGFEHVADNRCELFDPQVDLNQPFNADDSVDGRADPAGPGHLRGAFHQLQELKRKHPRLKIIMSLGGWGLSGGFSSAAEPQNVRGFVHSCVQMFIRGRFAPGIVAPGIFDGIDWEFPVSGGTVPGRPEDTRNLTAMAAEFRRQLDGVRPGLWLTAAIPGTERDFAHFDLKGLSRSMNDLAIMAYDMIPGNNPITGFASAMFRDPANPAPGNNYGAYGIQAFLRAGVPVGKIVLGVPFGEGRHWSGVKDINHGLYQPAAPRPALRAPGATGRGAFPGGPQSLPASADRQYWLAAGSCSVWYQGNFWTYDCPQALRAKMAYVRSHHLRGVMFWELGHDPAGELLRALAGTREASPR